MIINIFGVGSSGTSALFSTLQKIMKDQLVGPIKPFYEPFLRDPSFFQGEYASYSQQFPYTDSLSAEGIFNHTALPLLINCPKRYLNNSFLQAIYGLEPSVDAGSPPNVPSNKQASADQHRLIKYIRGNGRYKLIETMLPEAKSVFIIRNPLDVANSVKNRFSFYGGEFHKDDEQRLIQEVNKQYQKNYSLDTFNNYIDSQLFYWYYMSKFALESFSESKNPPYIICYEEFFSDIEGNLPPLLDYLGLDAKDEYVNLFGQRVGPTTKKKQMHREELDVCKSYLSLYFELLKDHKVYFRFSEQDIIGNYSTSGKKISNKTPNYGLHARAIENNLRRQKSEPKTKNLTCTQNKKPVFLHIINPVVVNKSSDLHIAQPITFETMETAKSHADLENISVEQVAVFYPEDEKIVPGSFGKCSLLDRSCLDFHTFKRQRKLPLLQDILTKAYEYSDADYVIYTNVDIALMPHFYVTAQKIMGEGYDAVNIFRRTLSSQYSSVDEIPSMYADLGEDHPGVDCFIIKRSLLKKIDLKNIVIGSRFVALSLSANLHVFADNIAVFTKKHMTFHIGDDREWHNHNEYNDYNSAEADKIFDALFQRSDVKNIQMLESFHKKFKDLKNRAPLKPEQEAKARAKRAQAKARTKAQTVKKITSKIVSKIKSKIPAKVKSKIKSKVKSILSVQ
jgi:hypothetical protein